MPMGQKSRAGGFAMVNSPDPCRGEPPGSDTLRVPSPGGLVPDIRAARGGLAQPLPEALETSKLLGTPQLIDHSLLGPSAGQ
jgi:hypothetical protein